MSSAPQTVIDTSAQTDKVNDSQADAVEVAVEENVLPVTDDDPPADGEIKEKTSDLSGKARAGGRAGPARDVLNFIESILKQVERDNQDRGNFTQNLCKSMREKYPAFNFIICHVKHQYSWDGTKGQDWDHWHEEFDIKIGGTIGYEVYWARSGTFTRQGDGGFLNWAYQGRVTSRSPDGTTIVFANP